MQRWQRWVGTTDLPRDRGEPFQVWKPKRDVRRAEPRQIAQRAPVWWADRRGDIPGAERHRERLLESLPWGEMMGTPLKADRGQGIPRSISKVNRAGVDVFMNP